MVQPVNGVTLICAWEPCKQPFTVFPSKVGKAKYCSRQCQWLATAAGRETKVTLICANPQCQKPFQVHANTMQRGSKVRCCSRACKTGYAASRIDAPEFAEEFWSQVAIGEPEACWPWQRRLDGDDRYGMIYVPGTQKDTGAHIVAFYLTHGRWPAPGIYICHRCNFKPCCNSAHLYEGTHLDNSRDAALDGLYPTGERHHNSKLTDAQWQEILVLLAESSLPRRTIAAQYGITYDALVKREKGYHNLPLRKRRKTIKRA